MGKKDGKKQWHKLLILFDYYSDVTHCNAAGMQLMQLIQQRNCFFAIAGSFSRFFFRVGI